MTQLQHLNLSGTCFWHYYERCNKAECSDCRNYKNVRDVLPPRAREEPEEELEDKKNDRDALGQGVE